MQNHDCIMSDYDAIIKFLEWAYTLSLDGDFVEIGVFVGAGTKKLSNFISKTDKKIYAIDLFDPNNDTSRTTNYDTICRIMRTTLQTEVGDEDQYKIYLENIKDCKNVVTLKGDSKFAKIPTDKICFSYIDGNHHADYAESDFYLIWDKTVHNGIIIFHDYGSDLPQVTNKINELIVKHKSDIVGIHMINSSTIALVKR